MGTNAFGYDPNLEPYPYDVNQAKALLAGVDTRDRVLLSTGRVSSEMLLKGARMGTPVVVSRTSPTEMAISIAEQLGVTVVGYLRHDAFNVYAGGDHLTLGSA